MKNRTFNLQTYNSPNCRDAEDNSISKYVLEAKYQYKNSLFWNSPTTKTKLIGFRNSEWYNMDWYSYRYGNYINSYSDKSNLNSKIVLKHNTLPAYGFDDFVDGLSNPIMWFVINRDFSKLGDAEIISEDNEDSDEKIISPNPFQSEIEIQTELEIKSLIIRDLTGKLVYQSKDISQHKINLNHLPSGVYLVYINGNPPIKTFKL